MPQPESDVVFNWIPEDDLGQLRLVAIAGDVLTIEPYRLNASWEMYSFFPFLPQFHERQTDVVIDVSFRRDAFLTTTIEQFKHDMLYWARKFAEEAAGSSLEHADCRLGKR